MPTPGYVQPESDEHPSAGGGWVFWLLFALAVTAFAPCVILPAWRDYQATRRVEQLEQVEVQRMQAGLDRQRRLADALRSDPSVITRAAQRELGYTKPGELWVDVTPSDLMPDAPAPQAQVVTPVEPPAPLKWLTGCLPALDYDAVFCDPSTRAIIMTMSGGVLMAAFALFPPRRRAGAPPTSG